jgi:hypothetical protein
MVTKFLNYNRGGVRGSAAPPGKEYEYYYENEHEYILNILRYPSSIPIFIGVGWGMVSRGATRRPTCRRPTRQASNTSSGQRDECGQHVGGQHDERGQHVDGQHGERVQFCKPPTRFTKNARFNEIARLRNRAHKMVYGTLSKPYPWGRTVLDAELYHPYTLHTPTWFRPSCHLFSWRCRPQDSHNIYLEDQIIIFFLNPLQRKLAHYDSSDTIDALRLPHQRLLAHHARQRSRQCRIPQGHSCGTCHSDLVNDPRRTQNEK